MSRSLMVNGVWFSSRYADDLTEDELEISWTCLGNISQKIFAVHEAGHAVTALAEGYPVNFTEVYPPRIGSAGQTSVRVDEGRLLPSVAFYAGGERAADRWMREQGLWTVKAAVANEAGAFVDRKYYNWHTAHDMTDKVLDRHWDSVLAVAEALYERKRLERDDVADIVGSMDTKVEIT